MEFVPRLKGATVLDHRYVSYAAPWPGLLLAGLGQPPNWPPGLLLPSACDLPWAYT